MLTIVMYHYVRDLPRTRFPRLKGLLTEKFEGQLDYISRHYTVCNLAQVIAASRGQEALPSNACVLTFDDGLLDHYETVLPQLRRRNLTGAFFPPARPVDQRCMLDVHKIQFILAATMDYELLMGELLKSVEDYRRRFAIPRDDELRKQYALPSRYDSSTVTFIKRMLQWVLPGQVRSEITDRLFKQCVSQDAAAFADELYMQPSHLREMLSFGMEIGGHGYSHEWLAELSREAQTQEIDRTVSFLCDIYGRRPSDWAMCYPFGSYNIDTLRLVSGAGCAVGLTTSVGIADLSRPLELARLDTNDLPTTAKADICKWTQMIG